ncbi:heparan sulfate glucosamine 3-O-sulfotransferase 3B1 [Polymorphobacter glacialis]|uniref:Heparan sulfate glucosamine 3-O-sulfotransferase 3B1 n=1 Tax=Sandarakinorhabdus glacialis TaxID=1614636 RepID=A0A917EA97_9SPHN|nr:sulfotransferase [Polymorphobacter glacialis]GGE14492.1 heparan sulfate glucosamine 3-O-sulfotransferase 3B1 [Polymorphobacter glacialis]
MARAARLPQFVIIGAVKAATTWIAHQLRSQPSIFLPKAEPHFFSSNYDRGAGWYSGLFADAGDDLLIGEKSADYLAHPRAAQRLAHDLPKVRLVVQLRNPIDRAYSDYCMLYRRGSVDGQIERYLGNTGEQPRFLTGGLYRQHLARVLEHFPAEQLQIILYDDIRAKPEATLHHVGKHIGARAALHPVAIDEYQNDSRAPMLPLAVRKLMAPIKPAIAPLRSSPLFAAVHRRLSRPVAYPPLTSDLRLRLRDFYAEDVRQLGMMIGRDLRPWLAMGKSE